MAFKEKRIAKTSGEKKVFEAMDWLAALTAHIPDRGEQMVRYYGWYSNKSPWNPEEGRPGGNRGPSGAPAGPLDRPVPAPLGPVDPNGHLISELQWTVGCTAHRSPLTAYKVYEVDPLVCSKCQGEMKIISITRGPPGDQEDPDPSGALGDPSEGSTPFLFGSSS